MPHYMIAESAAVKKSIAYWRAEADVFCKRALAAETEAFGLREQLAATTARAEAAEAELATLRRYADDADRATAERIARIDKLEAKLDAVPVDDICKAIAQIEDDWRQSARAVRAWLDTRITQSEVQP